MTEPHGAVELTDAGPVVRFERRYAHPREKVWRALTESEHLVQWMPCDMVGERAAGSTITLRFHDDVVERHQIEDPDIPGKIDVWEPPEVFQWWWGPDRLRFELEEVDGGTVMRFTTWLAPENEEPAHMAASGYHHCLSALTQLLDTGSGPELVDDVSPELEAEYERIVAAASA